MQIRQLSRDPKQTLIERIFEEVVGRKMTQAERKALHLKPTKKRSRKLGVVPSVGSRAPSRKR